MWFGKACFTKLHYQIWGFQEQIKHTTTSLAKTQLHPRNRSQQKKYHIANSFWLPPQTINMGGTQASNCTFYLY